MLVHQQEHCEGSSNHSIVALWITRSFFFFFGSFSTLQELIVLVREWDDWSPASLQSESCLTGLCCVMNSDHWRMVKSSESFEEGLWYRC